MKHTLESLQELEDYVNMLEESVGLDGNTVDEILSAINKERKKLL